MLINQSVTTNVIFAFDCDILKYFFDTFPTSRFVTLSKKNLFEIKSNALWALVYAELFRSHLGIVFARSEDS